VVWHHCGRIDVLKTIKCSKSKYPEKNIVVFQPLKLATVENFEGHFSHEKDFSKV
jgi:hypothetical protein